MPTLWLILSLAAADASPRTSANYTIATDNADAGGKRTTSASYSNDASVGPIAGISTVPAPAETAKSGYIGQLYEVSGLTLNAATSTLNEGVMLQLAAWQLLDDATFLAVPAASVAWSVAGGPLTSINANGLATAGVVYQNTAASVQGDYSGNTGSLSLTILDSIADNFGTYAGDSVGDDWQVQYFGLPPNASAGPNVDFGGSGQTNLFKYIAGLNPLDPNSRFTLKIQSVPGQPAQKKLIFTPRLPGRTYTVASRPGLTTDGYTPLTNPSAPADNGQERTITDLNASGALKFYRVEITKP